MKAVADGLPPADQIVRGEMSSRIRLRRVTLLLALPAAVLSLLAGLALLPFSSAPIHAAGYCFASLIPFLLVAAQRREAMRLQAEQGVVRAAHERWLSVLVLGIGFFAAAAHAWYFAWGVS